MPIDLTWRKCHHDSDFNFVQIGFSFAENQDRHEILVVSIMSIIGSFSMELSALTAFLIWAKCCHHYGGFSFNRISFILADNKDRHFFRSASILSIS